MFSAFYANLMKEDGAVTVDWVVLTGAAIALVFVMIASVNGSVSDVAEEIETVLSDVTVVEIGTLGTSD